MLQGRQLLLGADRDQHVPRADRGLQWRIGQECSVMAAEGEHECPGCLAHIRLLQRAPGEPGQAVDPPGRLWPRNNPARFRRADSAVTNVAAVPRPGLTRGSVGKSMAER